MISIRRARLIIGLGIILGICAALTPLLLRAPHDKLQARPLAGEVVSVASSTIVIKNRHGKELTLVLASSTDTTAMHGEAVHPGSMIQVFGVPDTSGQFMLTAIRPLEVPTL